MEDKNDILQQIREASRKNRLYMLHALQQMNRPDRMISPEEIRRVIDGGDVIEDYPEDTRGHSCLMLGRGESGRPIHVVCAPKQDYLAIITAYIPDEKKWTHDFKVRKQS